MAAFRMSSIRRVVIVAVAGIAAACSLHAQKPSFNESAVKAVFLFNLAQFVEWPAGTFSNPRSPFVICVLGEDTLGQELDNAVKGQEVRKRPIVVERFRRIDDIRTCQTLFITRSEVDNYLQIIAALQRRPILTVGDDESFSRRGGMIRLLTAENRVLLAVNLPAAKAVGLTISSNLLRVAQMVMPERSR
jgi:hypothetical protein